MHRTVIAVAALALLAACAPAATAAPEIEEAFFKVSVKGVQTTEWSTDHPAGPGCDSAVTGSGTEKVRFASRPLKLRAMVMEGLSTPLLSTVDTVVEPRLKLRGKVTRQGDLDAAPDPLCGGTGGGSLERDCGTRALKGVGLALSYRLAAKPKDQLELRPDFVADPFVNCPSGAYAFPTLVTSREGAPMRTDLPRSELFDRGLGKIIVIARGVESQIEGEHTYVTRTRWEITFRRVRGS